MTLSDLADRRGTVSSRELAQDHELTREVQERLAALGILDPPADGFFGPVSDWGIDTFRRLAFNAPPEDELDFETAEALLDLDADELLPLRLGSDLASRLVRAMQRRDFWIARAPGTVNIVYVEGMDDRGRFNDDRPNYFNDARLVLSATDRPRIEGMWEATTEPGKYYTAVRPMNRKGAARLAFGQYKAWTVGKHPRSGGHEALRQNGTLRVHRDLNKDYRRKGDAEDVGGGFGINQHWGYDNPVNDIGKASAGCLVGRTRAGHRHFMALLKDDPRYRASRAYKFMTALLDGRELRAEFEDEDRERDDRRRDRIEPIPIRPPVRL